MARKLESNRPEDAGISQAAKIVTICIAYFSFPTYTA